MTKSIKDYMTKEMIALSEAMAAASLNPRVEIEMRGNPGTNGSVVRSKVSIIGSRDVPGHVISECQHCGHVEKTYGSMIRVLVVADRLISGKLQVSAGVNGRRAMSFRHAIKLVNQLPKPEQGATS